MNELSNKDIHDKCLGATSEVISGFGWNNISVGTLSDTDKQRLKSDEYSGTLDWQWAMERYQGSVEDGILDISLKVIDHNDPDSLHAVILCKYDPLRGEFAICMLENFLAKQRTPLTGNVLIIALIYSTTFCDMTGIEDIIIQDPTDEARPRYRSYGFAAVWNDLNKISASLDDIKQRLIEKISRFEQ